jgi:hypothetical protein
VRAELAECTVYDSGYTHSDADFGELRDLCLAAYATGHKPSNWRVAMLENWAYSSRYLEPPAHLTSRVHLWRSGEGRLLGSLIHYWDLAWLQLLPGSEFLADRMLDWAERNWAGGQGTIETMAYGHDAGR